VICRKMMRFENRSNYQSILSFILLICFYIEILILIILKRRLMRRFNLKWRGGGPRDFYMV